MGEKHNTWRTSWIPTLLVVVRNNLVVSLTVNMSRVFLCGYVCFMTCLVHSVFWDLYCAAPERRETCDHSSEAKAFHDYVSSAYTGKLLPKLLRLLLEKTTTVLLRLRSCVNNVPPTCIMSQNFFCWSYQSKVLIISVCQHSSPDKISHILLKSDTAAKLQVIVILFKRIEL